MTTIAYRDGVIAGDTAINGDGMDCGRVQKVWRDKAGRLAGICGPLSGIPVFRDWFLAGAEGTCEDLPGDDPEGFIVDPTGVISWVGKNGVPVAIEAPFIAIGSGFAVAMGAMHAGATAEQAVRIAAAVDLGTREPIITLTHEGG